MDELGWAAHVHQRFPGAGGLPLSPPAHSWPAKVIARHLHLYADLAYDRRQFTARALPVPQAPAAAAHHRGAHSGLSSMRSLMAKSARRIVYHSPTSARALLVYEFGEAAAGRYGEAEFERVWEVKLPSDVGVGPAPLLPPLEQAPTLRVRAERLAENGAAPAGKGSGALLSPDLTGLAFVPPSWTANDGMLQDAARPRDVFLSFGTGALQRVRLPPPPPPQPSRPKKSRRGHVSAPTPALQAALVQTLPHPASSIESLSISEDHLVVTSLSGAVRLYHRHDVSSPSVIDLAMPALDGEPTERCRPYAALRSEDRRFTAVGAAGSTVDRSLLIFQSDETGAAVAEPRSLLPALGEDPQQPRNPAVYALSASPLTPSLLLSGWSSPASSLCVHDLRRSSRRPVFAFTDKIADQPFYSTTSSFLRSDGGFVMGGMGSRGHVGLFDTRAGGGRASGWTVYAPSGAAGRQASGAVGSLVAEGGRVWGCTPQAAFCLDFTLGAGAEEDHVVRYYEHAGGRTA